MRLPQVLKGEQKLSEEAVAARCSGYLTTKAIARIRLQIVLAFLGNQPDFHALGDPVDRNESPIRVNEGARSPIQAGQVVAVIAWLFGLWWLNACRIVYLVEEEGPVKRFGFAYGTLPQHAESGEERFSVEWHEQDNAVWYDILAFSRPNQLLARLGYPLVRRAQKRFGRDSAAALLQIVQADAGA